MTSEQYQNRLEIFEGRIKLRVPAKGTGPAELVYLPPTDITPLIATVPTSLAPKVVRKLHGICGNVQEHACRLAMEAATGEIMSEAERAQWEIACLGESMREHGLRIALFWSSLVGEPEDHEMARAFVAAAREPDADSLNSLIARYVTGIEPQQWLDLRAVDELDQWCRSTQSVAARFLASIRNLPRMSVDIKADPGTLMTLLGDHPLLSCADTPGSIFLRHCSRIIDLCQATARLKAIQRGTSRATVGSSRWNGHGIAEVTCSRGILVHELQVENGRVASYRISSPTERLFAEGGFAAQQFAKLAMISGINRRKLCEIMMQAFDPCIAYEIEVS